MTAVDTINKALAELGYTNKSDLPPIVTAFLIADDYDFVPEPNKFSISDLINPPALVTLQRRHNREVTRDVLDRVWLAIGNAVHRDALRKLDKLHGGAFTEERVYHTLTVDGVPVTIGGKSDVWYPINEHPKLDLVPGAREAIEAAGEHVDDYGVVADWKTTSVWAMIFRDKLDDWRRQLSAYAWLLNRYAGLKTLTGENYVLMRDWRPSEKRQRGDDYPATSFELVRQPLYGVEDTEAWIVERVRMLLKMQETPDAELDPCSPAERWEKEGGVAIMRVGRKSALRLAANVDDAYAWANREGIKIGGAVYLEERKGRRTRCEDYCEMRAWCPLYTNGGVVNVDGSDTSNQARAEHGFVE